MKAKRIIGIVGAVLMIVSGLVHCFLGWPAMRQTLAKTNAGTDFLQGLAIPWFFAGMAMIAFGAIAIDALLRAWKDATSPLRHVAIIGVCYTAFAIAMAIFTGFNPVVLLFGVPGIMLLVAAGGAL
jgi:hypothetical protein